MERMYNKVAKVIYLQETYVIKHLLFCCYCLIIGIFGKVGGDIDVFIGGGDVLNG